MTDLTHEISNRQNARTNRAKSPYINVIYPNSSKINQHDIIPITWDYGYINNFYYPNVKIELYKNDELYGVISNLTNNSGLYNAMLSTNVDDYYKIKISLIGNEQIYNYSENFTIQLGSSITLLSPNGSESWINESCYYITWQSIYLSGNVKIELYKNEILHSVITESVAYDLEIYEWYIPYTVFEDDDYKVKISSIESPTVFDFSNANFEIKRKVAWILTNKYYGTDITYTDDAWILTNYKYPENTKDGNTNGTLLTNFSYPINDKDSNTNGTLLTNFSYPINDKDSNENAWILLTDGV